MQHLVGKNVDAETEWRKYMWNIKELMTGI